MMISTVFIIMILCTLYSLSTTTAGILNNTLSMEETGPSMNQHKQYTDFLQYLNTFEHKIDTFSNVLSQIDSSVQQLQEKSHNWAIFRHHIDSWNNQMQSVEHKLELVKRSQDECHAYGSKLDSLEFTLNHILRKVIFLNEAHGSSDSETGISDDTSNEDENNEFKVTLEHEELLKNFQRTLNAEHKLKNEISTRLSNVLRHLQNIENDNCDHVTSAGTLERNMSDNNMDKVLPASGNGDFGCNNSQQHYGRNVEQSLKILERKVNLIATTFSQKDFKQIQSLSKKNAKTIERILAYVTTADRRLTRFQEDGMKHLHSITDYCQSVSSELSTFTESSDLLLKRIELIINDADKKLHSYDSQSPCGQPEDERVNISEPVGSKIYATSKEDNLEYMDTTDDALNNELHETDSKKIPIIERVRGEKRNISPLLDMEDNPVKTSASGMDEKTEFVQPHKKGCHELDGPKVDGIYKFLTAELNEKLRNFNERFCTYATDIHAWTVILNRGPYDDQENFNRSWADYRDGFGRLDKDFWFGNEFIHQIVDRDDYTLRVELEDFEGVTQWAEYGIFRLDSERYNYNLMIGDYRGTVSDALAYHNEVDFSTYDRRNDRSIDACCACATGYGSGWWFDNCSEANLNGIYHKTPTGHNYIGIIWESWHGDYSLKRARMLIRPKNLTQLHNGFTEDP